MFSSLSRTIGNVFEFSLPMIIISVVVAITLIVGGQAVLGRQAL